MPTNPPLPCPYCDKKIVSYYLYHHIVHQHTEQLLSYGSQTSYDSRNIRLFDPETPKRREKCLCLALPEGEDFYYCFGCDKGMKKYGFAQRHKSCMAKHAEGMQTIWEKYKHLMDGSAPANPQRPDAPPSFDTSLLEKLLWNFVKQDYAFKAQLDVAERHLEAIRESGKLTDEEFDDLEPMGAEGVKLKSIAWSLYRGIPCEKDMKEWIKKYEKPEQQEMWLNRLK